MDERLTFNGNSRILEITLWPDGNTDVFNVIVPGQLQTEWKTGSVLRLAVQPDGTVTYSAQGCYGGKYGLSSSCGNWRQVTRRFPPLVTANTGRNGGDSTLSTAETGVDRPGHDYDRFDLEPTIAGFGPCKSACESDANCKAWTYVKAGIQGPKAICWLKSAVPPPTPNGCCVSGAKAQTASAPQPAPEKPVKHTGRSNACVAYGDRMSAIAGEARNLGCKFVQIAPWNNPHDYWLQRCVAHSGDGVADSEEATFKQRLNDCKTGGGGSAAAAGGGGDQADNSCGGGTATVVINQPGLDKLNVRNGPDGQVTGTVPEGQVVSVTGPCGGTGGAAGIIANKPSGDDGGWCRISAPVSGCVSARFLKFGGGAAGFAKSAVGFAKSNGKQTSASAAAGFGGSWAANADNVAYSLSLQQNGNGVSGRYQGDDGSAGQINGKVSGNVLRFSWVQKDGTRGSGKFTLAGDGRSFAGSYNFGNNPDAVEGSWNGTRQ
ncbi:PAN domain-containing protein [Mesorhizobium sp.]|uniref:PAN domain-containing protein n=1 Tax=Mesorhizobium sp. TaxID=1871066 RepID=UPI0026195DA7|nr:PAN domain-containing protein [Mesorhizobium sp.]